MNENTPPPIDSALQPKTSALAIWSMVLGIVGVILSLICLGILLAIPAVICGHMALSRIKRSAGALTGQGLAITGLATGYVAIAMLFLLIPIAVPNFIKARNTAMENVCINNLRQIQAAKNEWALENGKIGSDVPTAADLQKYFRNGVFPVCPARGSYTIGAVTNPPTCTVAGHVLPEPAFSP